MVWRAASAGILLACLICSAARADDASFRAEVLKRFAGKFPGDIVSFDGDDVLELRSPVNGQSVFVTFAYRHLDCKDAPEGCPAAIDAGIDFVSGDLGAARALRDKRDADDDSLIDFRAHSRSREVILARTAKPLSPAPAGPAKASDVPLDPSEFAAYVEGRIRLYTKVPVVELTHRYALTVGQNLALSSQTASYADESWVLNDLHRACAAAPGDCYRLVTDRVQDIAGQLNLTDGSIDKTTFRAFLDTSTLQLPGYVLNKQQPRSYMDVFRTPFGKFYEVCKPADVPARIIRPNLDALHMTADEVLTLCEANTRKMLGSPDAAYGAALPADGIGMAMGSLYESARLLFPDEFAGLSGSLGGLLIAAPARNVIVYSKDGGPAAVEALAARARAIKAQSGNAALSASILRWSKDGWQVALAGE